MHFWWTANNEDDCFFSFEHLTQYDWWSQRTGCDHYYDEFCFILLLRVSCPSHTGFCIWDCGYPHTHHAHSHLSAEPVRALTHSLSFMHLWCPKHLWNNEILAKSQVHLFAYISLFLCEWIFKFFCHCRLMIFLLPPVPAPKIKGIDSELLKVFLVCDFSSKC